MKTLKVTSAQPVTRYDHFLADKNVHELTIIGDFDYYELTEPTVEEVKEEEVKEESPAPTTPPVFEPPTFLPPKSEK
jgi:hypothetical protein